MVFPDFESSLFQKQNGKYMSTDLNNQDKITILMYRELKHNFKKYLIQKYYTEIIEYLTRNTKLLDIDQSKDLLLSTISITFNIKDSNGNRINRKTYLETIKKMIEKFNSNYKSNYKS